MKPIWTILITVVLTAAIVGGGMYYVMNKNSDGDESALQAQIDDLSAKVSTTSTTSGAAVTSGAAITPSTVVSTGTAATSGAATTPAVVSATAGWKTLTDSHFGISFKYPATWPTSKSAYMTAEENDLIGVAESWASLTTDTLADKGKTRYVRIAKLSDFVNDPSKNQATQLKAVYANKSAAAAVKGTMLPPVNAATSGATTPVYIQTADGVFRGISYFASIGQDYSTTIDCVIVMTDNTNVITFHFAMPSDKASQYTMADGTVSSTFITYVQSLTSSSTESLVSEYNSVYKNIALSVTK